MPLTVSQMFGRYRIDKLIGRGGMGQVFLAWDEQTERPCVLKTLLDDASKFDDAEYATLRGRMLREARAAAQLNHPNIVAIYDTGEMDGTLFIAMEYVEGEPLRTRIRDKSVAWKEKLAWMLGVARALKASHSLGVIHRDIKPENIIVTKDGFAKVLDFGIAKRVSRSNVRVSGISIPQEFVMDRRRMRDSKGHTLYTRYTQEGSITGSPYYMAPEQVMSTSFDERVDQFAWGIVTYELLTGRLPWVAEGDPMIVLMMAVQNKERPPPMGSIVEGLPQEVDDVVMRTLSFDENDRFDSMQEVIAALARWDPSRTRLGTEFPRPQVSRAPRGIPEPKRSPGIQGFANVAMVLAALLALVGLGYKGYGRHDDATGTGNRPDSSNAVNVKPTPVTSLPEPSFQHVQSRDDYRAALVSWRRGDRDDACARLEGVVVREPYIAIAQLRLAICKAAAPYTHSEAREPFARAVRLKSTEGPYVQACIDALIPFFQQDPPDLAEVDRRLDRMRTQFPGDADSAFWQGFVRGLHGNLIGSLISYEHAIALDPEFAYAWEVRAESEAYLGRFDSALTSIDHCLKVVPNSSECRRRRLYLSVDRGHCEDAEQDLRVLMEHSPRESLPYAMMAVVLVAQGRWEESQSNLETAIANLSPAARVRREPLLRAKMAMVRGEFSDATKLVTLARKALRNASSNVALADVENVALELSQESGTRDASAGDAKRFIAERDAQASSDRADDTAILTDPFPRALGILKSAGAISSNQFDSMHNIWLDNWTRKTTSNYLPYVWLSGYARPSETEDDALRALDMLPKFGSIPPFTPDMLASYWTGRVYLLTGRVDDAITDLKQASNSCTALKYPIDHTRSIYYLGLALEKRGDIPGACEAYQRVLERWGKAKPRSVTADAARMRVAALRCSSSH